MLFITNRSFQEGYKSTINRAVSFALDNNSPSNAIYYCNRKAKANYLEIGSANFMADLQQSSYQQILIYIHGFNNLPEENIFPIVEKLQKYFNDKEKNLVLVLPIIWPCDNDFGIIKDYWDDQKSADMSAFSLARTLNKFINWSKQSNQGTPCLKRINILAHSMGNRVLRETLRVWNKYDLSQGIPRLFRNVFLIAADVVNETLEYGQPGELICHAARNVLVYYANDDLALRGSKVMNSKNMLASRRLGHSGPEDLNSVPANVYTIDCDEINNKYDDPNGHSYFINHAEGTPGVVFEHIYTVIKTGRFSREDSSLKQILLTEEKF